jgi:Uma2 family endonuclease
MIATTTEYAEIARRMTEGEVLHLTDISWEDYEELLTELEGQRNVRLTYDGGRLQIMVVSSKHESYSRRIYDLITVLADETGQDAEGFGSMTLRKRRKAKGTEPDECFYVQNAARVIGREDLDFEHDPPPDLALEIDVTHGSVSKLPIYAELGVPEVWHYDEMCIMQARGGYGKKSGSVHRGES